MIYQITSFFMGVVFTVLGIILGGLLGWFLMLVFCFELVTLDGVLNELLEGRTNE